jgi:hypothetical protein
VLEIASLATDEKLLSPVGWLAIIKTMQKGVKIFLGIVIGLAVLSGVFLLVAKKKTPTAPTTQTQKATPDVKNSTVTPSTNNINSQLPQAVAPQKTTPSVSVPKTKPLIAKPLIVSAQDRKALIRSQWTQCKAKTFSATTNLMWNVQITEGIPAKGTYAKGKLDGDTAFPVHVIIKTSSTIAGKIKTMLVVGKNAFLRGTCTDVATDGAVVVQVF